MYPLNLQVGRLYSWILVGWWDGMWFQCVLNFQDLAGVPREYTISRCFLSAPGVLQPLGICPWDGAPKRWPWGCGNFQASKLTKIGLNTRMYHEYQNIILPKTNMWDQFDPSCIKLILCPFLIFIFYILHFLQHFLGFSALKPSAKAYLHVVFSQTFPDVSTSSPAWKQRVQQLRSDIFRSIFHTSAVVDSSDHLVDVVINRHRAVIWWCATFDVCLFYFAWRSDYLLT